MSLGAMAHMVEFLPNTPEALASISTMTRNMKNGFILMHLKCCAKPTRVSMLRSSKCFKVALARGGQVVEGMSCPFQSILK
jgi:hypothetical protein